ncbi:MAG: DUF4390 domain-containing protein [Desulfobacterales bacterium]
MASPAKHSFGLALLLGVMLAIPSAAIAQRAILSDITLSSSPDDLLLHVNVSNAFNEGLRQTVLGGAPTLFVFQVELKRVRSLWRNETIATIQVAQSIRYDDIRREFIVRRAYEGEPEITPSFEEAQAQVSRLEGFKISPLGRIERGLPYQLRVKAAAGRRSLPLGLHHVLFFMSFWDVETDWVIIDFIY